MGKKRRVPANREEKRYFVGIRKKFALLLAAVLGPLLLVLLLEATLRLVDYGYPAGFFTASPNGEVTNQKFGWRFFPHHLARTPVIQELPPQKDPETYRIFVLGGSAAMGTPDHAYGFPRMLAAMLAARYPDVRFEVVNAAMTAANSHVALPIARDCVDREPDLFIIYMGNNEVVGPFGAGSPFRSFSNSMAMIRANVLLSGTRFGQLVSSLGQTSTDAPAEWRGMEMFLKNQLAQDDPRLARIHDHFRTNLADLMAVIGDSGVDALLCTVATNLHDNAPFASQNKPNLSADRLAEWNRLYEAGLPGRDDDQDYASRLAALHQAAAIDDSHAGLHFAMAWCYVGLNQMDDAKRHFVKARDLDVLRFRADSGINQVIRETASRFQHVDLVDAEQLIEAASVDRHGIPGYGLFHEHVHLNLQGNHVLAEGLLAQVEARLPEWVGAPQEGTLDLAECLTRLGFNAWDEYRMTGTLVDMFARPPFINQLYSDWRLNTFREALDQQRARLSAKTLAAADQRLQQALAAAPDDLTLQHRLAQLTSARGLNEAALPLWEGLNQRVPDNAEILAGLGLAQAGAGDPTKAVATLNQALAVWPDAPNNYLNLASVLEEMGDQAGVRTQIEHLFNLDPANERGHLFMARQLEQRNALGEAEKHYRAAIAANPTNPANPLNLGVCLEKQNKLDAAVEQYLAALALQPRYARAHFNLGDAYFGMSRFEQAVSHYGAGLEMEPDNDQARYNLSICLQFTGNFAGAAGELEALLSRQPESPAVLNALALVLIETGAGSARDVARAVTLAESACRLTEQNAPVYLATLAAVYQAAGRQADARVKAVRAKDLAEASGDGALAARIGDRFQLPR